MSRMNKLPQISWVKNDPKLHRTFTDGSVFLVALEVQRSGETPQWELDVVEFDCDGDGAHLVYRGSRESYDAWSWSDFEYFALLEGEMPSADAPEDSYA